MKLCSNFYLLQSVMELKPSPDIDPKLGWKESQRMMTDIDFLGKLLNYSQNVEITPKMAKAAAAVIASKGLSEESVKKVSGAATGLLVWVEAVLVQ